MKTSLRTSLDAPNIAASLQLATSSRRWTVFSLPLCFSERRLLLIIGDTILLLLASLAAVVTWGTFRSGTMVTSSFIIRQGPWLIGLSLTWLAIWAALGGYDLQIAAHPRLLNRRVLITACSFAAIYISLFFIFSAPPAFLYPRSPHLGALRLLRAMPALFAVYALAGELGWRNLYARMLTGTHFQRRSLVVGAGWAGQTIATAIHEHGDGTYQVLGFVDDDPAKVGTMIPLGTAQSSTVEMDAESATPQVPVLGDRHILRELIQRYHVSTLILAITHEGNSELLPTLVDCLELGVEIVPMPVLYEELTGCVPVEHVGDNWYVAVPLHHPGTNAVWPLVKRLMDILLASLGLICLGLILPVIALAIYLDSPGPIFYSQKRVGRGGRIFRIYKFRSMVTDAEKGRALWAKENDPRVTHVGRFLRKTHLDELPQFYNILKGDMSVVGPRPERPEFAAKLAHEIPFYRVRHAVKPGAAGWGLVRQGYGASQEDALLKLQYDLYYVKHQSLRLDLSILAKTALCMLTLRGR